MAKVKEEFEDDGRTICSMDVEGMPGSSWNRLTHKPSMREQHREIKQKVEAGEAITRKEARIYTWYAILAALTVFAVVGGGVILFIFILWLCWR